MVEFPARSGHVVVEIISWRSGQSVVKLQAVSHHATGGI